MKLSIDDLHKPFESRVRLGIMSALAVNDALDFTSLRDFLATHIKQLEQEDFIGVDKSFIDNKPNTRYYMTDKGRKAFEEHLKVPEKIIKSQK